MVKQVFYPNKNGGEDAAVIRSLDIKIKKSMCICG